MKLRLATYNIEWFSALFDDENNVLDDREWSSRRDVTRREQLDALAQVFRAIDADGVLIVEAPDNVRTRSTSASLLAFCAHAGLPFDAVCHGFSNQTQQELAFLYKSDVMEAVHDPQGPSSQSAFAPRFDGKFKLDVDVDTQPEIHVFSKPPLEIALTFKHDGSVVRFVGVHIKSKAPHGARNKEHEAKISIDNRRKQLAQSVWLRRRIEGHLEDGADVMVFGDLNDGPGLDEYEELFGRSSVEIVRGDPADPATVLTDPHIKARLNPRAAWTPSSARFYVHHKKTYLNALLDYTMISRGLVEKYRPSWRIWHPFDDRNCFEDNSLREALLTASDHFPVTLDLQFD
jgi:endonuclease/exonuclease/phosphatase family metal-dependent hydrolase